MCTINAIILPENKSLTLRMMSYLEQATILGFQRNRDGEGAYFSGTNNLVKSDRKISYCEHYKDLVSSKVIITHQRLSTSGHSAEYHHPFANEEFVMVHNGVMSEFAKDGHSDTHVMFETLVEAFSKAEDEERTQRIVTAAKEVFDKKLGSYSVLLYDKTTGLSYYWKNASTTIHFVIRDDVLYISTDDADKLHPSKVTDVKIEDHKIYGIDGTASVFEIGQIEKYVYVPAPYTPKEHIADCNCYNCKLADEPNKGQTQPKYAGYGVRVKGKAKCDACPLVVKHRYFSKEDGLSLCKDCDTEWRSLFAGKLGDEMSLIAPCQECGADYAKKKMQWDLSYEGYVCDSCLGLIAKGQIYRTESEGQGLQRVVDDYDSRRGWYD